MKQENFEAQHAARWQAFTDGMMLPSNKRKELQKSGAAPLWPMDELPRRYRELCHHLALARDRQYSTALVERLEGMVLVGHQALYGARESSGGVLRFLLGGMSRLVRQEQRYVWAAALIFFGPLIGCLVAIQYFPDFAHVIIGDAQLAEAQQMFAPGNKRLGLQRNADSDFMMFGHYVANNVGINFQCFAGGILFGVGAIFFMVFNGLHIGAVAGHLTQVGYIETFWGFVAGHSAFELTGIVLSGASGLMLGMALIAPGRQTRFASAKARMPAIIGVLYAAALLTFLAAFIEGFWSASRGVPVEVKYVVGVVMWIVTLAYLVFAGRRGDVLERDIDAA